MIFTETKLRGAFIVDLDRKTDERGFFARAFCQNEFSDHGLKPVIAQANVASNAKKGTLRGMHFQYPPAAETKLVRCTRGAILDIIVDLRPESPTYLKHVSVELNEGNMTALYVPERFAHGYQVLRDNTNRGFQGGVFTMPTPKRGLRARLSGAARQHGHELSSGRVLHAERRKRASPRRSAAGAQMAATGLGDL